MSVTTRPIYIVSSVVVLTFLALVFQGKALAAIPLTALGILLITQAWQLGEKWRLPEPPPRSSGPQQRLPPDILLASLDSEIIVHLNATAEKLPTRDERKAMASCVVLAQFLMHDLRHGVPMDFSIRSQVEKLRRLVLQGPMGHKPKEES